MCDSVHNVYETTLSQRVTFNRIQFTQVLGELEQAKYAQLPRPTRRYGGVVWLRETRFFIGHSGAFTPTL